MKQLLYDFLFLWREKPVFRVASLFLFLFLLLVLLLPWLPLPYSPEDLDLDQVYQSPFRAAPTKATTPVHWFGTDVLGHDVFTYTLYGARTAVFISLPVIFITTAIGLLLGTCAGFFGNTGLQVTKAKLVNWVAGAAIVLYFGLYLPAQLILLKAATTTILLSMFIMFVALLIVRLLMKFLEKKITFFGSLVALPLDRLVLWLIETLTSIPKLILILVLASFLPASVMLLSAILVLTYWTGTARLARAEILKIKQLPYFEAATALGASRGRLVFYHAFPNMLSPVVISFSFGLAGLLAFESTLSFLGIGVPPGLVSWGKMIAGIRENTAAWWVAAFPGGFLVLTVLALQLCSYYYLQLIRKRKT